MAKESSLWVWLKKASIEMREQLHMDRVENSVMAGMPDVEGYFVGHGQFWLELKSSERPARPNTPVRFKVKGREAQVWWLTKRWTIGGSAWLLLQVGSGAHRRIYLVPGLYSAEVYGGVTEARLQTLDRLRIPKPRPSDVVSQAHR